jgi:hypothetical protein
MRGQSHGSFLEHYKFWCLLLCKCSYFLLLYFCLVLNIIFTAYNPFVCGHIPCRASYWHIINLVVPVLFQLAYISDQGLERRTRAIESLSLCRGRRTCCMQRGFTERRVESILLGISYKPLKFRFDRIKSPATKSIDTGRLEVAQLFD